MTNNLLEGVQFRTTTVQFPSYNRPNQTDWVDITSNKRDFPSYTEFRLKPKCEYKVTVQKGRNDTFFTELKFDRKKDLNEYLINVPDDIYRVSFSREEKTMPTFQSWAMEKHIQYRLDGGTWTNFDPYSLTSARWGKIEFRLRPDYQFAWKSGNQNAQGQLFFDDADKLLAYLDKHVRTDGHGFTVDKVPYVG